VGGVALAARLAFGFRAPPFVTNDSLSYLLPGFDLARGLDFAPILKRPPLYPVFIGGVITLFGEEPRALVLVQHLLGVVTALCAFSIGRLLFGRPAGLLAGLLTALSGPLLVMEHYLMSESLFGTLLAGALLAFLLGVGGRGNKGWFALVGVLLGLAALTRPIAQLVVILLVLALPFLLPRRRAALVSGAVMLGCFGVTVLPWMARNWAVQGAFAIAGGLGEGLAVRTIRYDQQFDFREPPGGDGDRLLARARRIYREEAADGSAFELARRLREELGVSEVRADVLMRRIALDAIWSRPGYFLQGTAEMAARTFVGRPVRLRQDWTPWRNIAWEPRVAHLLPAPTPAEERAFPTAEALATLYDPARPPYPFVLSILFGVGALSGLAASRRPALLLAALVLGLVLAGAALIGIEWRYRYPLDPLINVLAAGGLAVSWQLAARWLGRRQTAPGGRASGRDAGEGERGSRAARADARPYPGGSG
jgi:4-amino-4-deoxy-L-arabinose transferase-like glycosyltransferase